MRLDDQNAGGGKFDYHQLRAEVTTGLMPALSRETKRQRKSECRISFKLWREREKSSGFK